MKKYLKLMRVTHYFKNLLIIVPIFFAEQINDIHKLGFLLYMIVPFCLISSVIYIINDIHDVDKDRHHPQKCKRPIASGAISIPSANRIIVLLLGITVAMLLAAMLNGCKCTTAIILLMVYFLINYAYSNGLKNVPILDITLLAAGYLIRLFYGGSIVNVTVSPWLYLTVLAGAFYLGLGKRRNEIRNVGIGDTRKVLQKYSYEFLDKNMYVCVGLALTFYALWAIQSNYVGMVWTVPLIILIFMKYSLDVENDSSEGDPIKVVLSDRVLISCIVGYVISVFIIIYFIGIRL